MRAIVLAGGRGSRLRGLTDSRSKVMLPLAGRPILEWTLRELNSAGISEAIIVHNYAGERILSYFGTGSKFGMKLSYAKQDMDLGTLGSFLTGFPMVKHDERVLIVNGDNLVRSESITRLLSCEGNALLVAEHESPQNYGVVHLSGDKVTSVVEKPEEYTSRLISTGVWLVSTSIIDEMESDLESGITGLSVTMNRLIDSGMNVQAVRTEDWFDVDYPWDLLSLNQRLLELSDMTISPNAIVHEGVTLTGNVHVGSGSVIHPGTVIEGPVYIGEDCEIGPTAVITGSTSITSGCRIGPFCRIRSSLLMEDVQIDSNSYLHYSVIGPGTHINCHVQVDVSAVELTVRGSKHNVRRLGLVTGESCVLEHGVICSPGTLIDSKTNISRRISISGEHRAED